MRLRPRRRDASRQGLRLRLTVVLALLFLACGTLLLAVTYLLVDRATGDSITYTSPEGRYTITLSGDEPDGVAGHAEGQTSHSTGPDGADPPPVDEDTARSLALQQHADSMHQLLTQGGIALGLATLGAAGLGWCVSGRILKPLRIMTTTVRDISATNLHRRLTVSRRRDELTALGETFNDLLARLEGSFDAQRQFVANASHELRTPLARQRTVGQVALGDPDATVDSLRAAHEQILHAGREQEQLIEALLALARGQADLDRRTRLDLADVARTAIAALPAACPVTVTSDLGPAPVAGDRRLLDRLVGNLLDNAVKHNIDTGTVDVATTATDGHAVLTVTNTGPVVTPADIEGFRRPFRRGAADRTGRQHGLGLGLPIVEAIAESHGATVSLRPRAGGGLVTRVEFGPPDSPEAPGTPRQETTQRPVERSVLTELRH